MRKYWTSFHDLLRADVLYLCQMVLATIVKKGGEFSLPTSSRSSAVRNFALQELAVVGEASVEPLRMPQ